MEQWEAAQWENQQDMLAAIRQWVGEAEYAFLLRYFSGPGAVEQMAREEQVSPGSLWKRKQRIMERIKRRMARLTPPAAGGGRAAPGGPAGGGRARAARRPEKPEGVLSRQSAEVVVEFLHRLPAEAFTNKHLELLDLCYRTLDPQYGKDPVDVEAAIRSTRGG